MGNSSIVPNERTAGSRTTYVVTINSLANKLESGDYLQIVFPSNWTLPVTVNCRIEQPKGVEVTNLGVAVSNQTLQVRVGAVITSSSSAVIITCENLVNPPHEVAASSNIKIFTSKAGTSLVIDQTTDGTMSAIIPGTLLLFMRIFHMGYQVRHNSCIRNQCLANHRGTR